VRVGGLEHLLKIASDASLRNELPYVFTDGMKSNLVGRFRKS
jgi:hypothetical protein